MKKIIIGIAFLLTGCAAYNAKVLKKEMDHKLNKPEMTLMRSYGPPAMKVSDGAAGMIWVYADQFYEPPYTLYTEGGPVTTPSKQWWNYKMFYVNSQGIVYYWLTKSEVVPPQRIDMTIYQNVRVTSY